MNEEILKLAEQCGLRFHYDDFDGLEAFYRSASCDDVARIVDSEMFLRGQVDALTAQREELRTALHWAQQELLSWDDSAEGYNYWDSLAAQALEKTK